MNGKGRAPDLCELFARVAVAVSTRERVPGAALLVEMPVSCEDEVHCPRCGVPLAFETDGEGRAWERCDCGYAIPVSRAAAEARQRAVEVRHRRECLVFPADRAARRHGHAGGKKACKAA